MARKSRGGAVLKVESGRDERTSIDGGILKG